MNDKEIMEKTGKAKKFLNEEGFCLGDIFELMQKARQDEREKQIILGKQIEYERDTFQAENAEFKKKLANRKKLKKLLLDVHNCEGCGHRCVLHVDAWCDIIEDLMEQELSEKQKGME